MASDEAGFAIEPWQMRRVERDAEIFAKTIGEAVLVKQFLGFYAEFLGEVQPQIMNWQKSLMEGDQIWQ